MQKYFRGKSYIQNRNGYNCFSGGGAEIKVFKNFSSKILNRRVRVARPYAFHRDIGKPEFSTLNGLIKICNDLTFKNLLLNKSIQNDNGILDRLNNWFR